VSDSAFVEVRNADVSWRFGLLTDWRSEPGAPRGIAILFNRNPRPMDTPLPVGISCDAGAACGALSLRRLPPPVAHIALDYAGFDSERFGLIGMLRLARNGYEVMLPRRTYYVERGASRPVAVPVAPLESDANGRAPRDPDDQSRWILLAASGGGDNVLEVLQIGGGLALLLFALQSAVRRVPISDSRPLTDAQERAIAVGLVALLGLVLTRVIVGARVAFFDPFLDRGMETAVGLCTAITIVSVGLLTWARWLPPLLATAHSALGGRLTIAGLARNAVSSVREALRTVSYSRHMMADVSRTATLALALVLLTVTTGWAPWQGLFTGGVVLLVWGCVAWVAAFSGSHFDTYERGAHSVIEQSPPPLTSGGIRLFLARIPEFVLLLAVIALTLTHMYPVIGGIFIVVVLPIVFVKVWQRRHGTARPPQPDYWAMATGVSMFGAFLALVRLFSVNGSLGALVLVVLVALASVRIGRAVSARLEARARANSRSGVAEWFVDALLLVAPLILLLPLAAIDVGLGLVFVIPLGCATLLATGVRTAGSRLVMPSTAMVVLLFLGWQVVFPSVEPIRTADSHAKQAEAFARMSTLGGLRIPFIGTSMDRAAARSVATRDRELAEALLVAARPGAARDLLLPSIEQIWGSKAYASAGMSGEGLGRAAIGGRGVAEAVSYAENTFSVFVLAEHGALGGSLVGALYALLTFAVAVLTLSHQGGTSSYRASRALFLIAALIVAIPACYVALSNLALVPITGQNMPFLGLNAWSDVAICAGVVGILITGTLRAVQEP
jgi:hypothetical protein